MGTSSSARGIGPRATFLILSAIVVLAIVVRLDRVGAKALATDEGFSWRLSRDPVAEIARRTASDVHPPLYYILLHEWMAIFGDSAAAMRSLSVVFGVAAVPMLFLVVIEGARGPGQLRSVDRSSALLAAFLLATNASQVELSRSARMYPLGVFLAAAGAWLLLRALRPGPPRTAWWLAYGAATSVFLWTHNAAAFTVAAQGLWVVATAARSILVGEGRGEARRRLLGLAVAATVAMLAYGPWIPVVLRQFREVRRDYWIEPLGWKTAGTMLTSWGIGVSEPGTIEVVIALAAMTAAVGWILYRADSLGGFFLVHAALPWGVGLGVWLATGRPILLDRVLAFAQLAVFGTWAAARRRAGDAVARVAIAGALSLASLGGLAGSISMRPNAPQVALEKAATYLAAEARTGDLILANSPSALNRFRHAISRTRVAGLDVRCPLRRSARDTHISHAASLTPADVLWTTRGAPDIELPPRVWTIHEPTDRLDDYATLIHDFHRIQRTDFSAGDASIVLSLYIRDRAALEVLTKQGTGSESSRYLSPVCQGQLGSMTSERLWGLEPPNSPHRFCRGRPGPQQRYHMSGRVPTCGRVGGKVADRYRHLPEDAAPAGTRLASLLPNCMPIDSLP